MTPELHRPISLHHIGSAGVDVSVVATEAECKALAERMGLPAIASVRGDFHLIRDRSDVITVTGRLEARLTQTCVISLEDFDATIEDEFSLRFVPAGSEVEEIDPDADDEIPYEGVSIDLGEATAEQLALSLDPYPRMPGAELPEAEEELPDHPFAALRRLN